MIKKSWMDAQWIKHGDLKGFTAYRFGLIAEIAREYLSYHQSILDFFDAVVDPNANKLVLVVSTYIQNGWFLCCAEVDGKLGDVHIIPLMVLLGIDKCEDHGSGERTWKGVRSFSDKRIPDIRAKQEECMNEDNGQARLYGAVLNEILDTQGVDRCSRWTFSQEKVVTTSN